MARLTVAALTAPRRFAAPTGYGPLVSGNRILSALPPAERQRLLVRLEPCRHRVREAVYEQGERVRTVVFPISGVFSLVVVSEGRAPVEIATVGHEGFVGLPVFLQATLTGAHRAFAQVEGDGLRMDAVDFLDAINDAPALRVALQRYAMALMTQIARGTACNRLHTAEQRAGRWILQTHDRVQADAFALPAAFLAQMLGEADGAVDVAAGALTAAGAIAYDGDVLEVRDRSALERASCDCYGIVRGEYERLLAPFADG